MFSACSQIDVVNAQAVAEQGSKFDEFYKESKRFVGNLQILQNDVQTALKMDDCRQYWSSSRREWIEKCRGDLSELIDKFASASTKTRETLTETTLCHSLLDKVCLTVLVLYKNSPWDQDHYFCSNREVVPLKR